MKKILFALVLLSANLFSQQFPIGSFRITNDVPPVLHPGINDPETQLTTIFPLLQDGFFNCGVAFTHSSSPTYINQLLDAANSHGVGIMLPDVVDSYSNIERYYLAGNSAYFTIVGGVLEQIDNDAETPFGITENPNYVKQSRKANSTTEYLVASPVSNVVLYGPPEYSSQTYRATFRLKVRRTTPLDPDDEIALLEVEIGSTTHSRTLKSSDFPTDLVYTTFSIDFTSIAPTPPPPPSPIPSPKLPIGYTAAVVTAAATAAPNFRVIWRGNGELWFDNVRIDGARDRGANYAINLFNGVYDTQIQTNASAYISKPALMRFYLEDEPFFTQYFATRYVNSQLEAAGANTTTGKGLGHAAIDDSWYSGDFSRYAIEARPFELAPDIYRFFYDDPLPSAGNYTSFTQLGDGGDRSGLQTQIGKFRNSQQSSAFTRSGNWWYYPNIGLWNPPGQTISREPYLSEVYAQVYLALAYGAKGIMYFNFWNDNYSSTPSPRGSGVTGLIHDNDLTPITNSHWGENKWQGIKTLNQKLAGPFGQILMNLTFQGGKSWHNGSALTWSGIITAVTSKTTVGVADAADQIYVETTHLKQGSTDYIFVVNRRTNNTESRNVTINLNTGGASWEISDVSSGKIWIVAPGGNFTDNFAPGEGKLYKVGAATWSVTKNIITTVTVPSGATLTINAGTNINFPTGTQLIINGILNANGASSQFINFNRVGTSGTWGGIQFNNGATGTLNYCTIRNATYGVFSGGDAHPTIQNCQITNNTYGVMCSNGGVYSIAHLSPTIQNCTISGNSYGIYYSGSGINTNAISSNTITSNSSHGIYLEWMSSPQNICYNTISGNGGHGIYYYYGNPHIYNNTISGNGGIGLYGYGGVSQGSTFTTLWQNTIESNSEAIHAESSKWIYPVSANTTRYNWAAFEAVYYSGIGASYGGNSSSYDEMFVSAYSYSNVYALGNCWMWGEGISWDGTSYCEVDYNCMIDYSIQNGSSAHQAPVSARINASSSSMKSVSLPKEEEVNGSDDDDLNDPALAAIYEQMRNQKYNDAIAQYSQRLKSIKSVTVKKHVLNHLAECYRRAEKKDFIQFLDKEVRKGLSKNDELYATALTLENSFLVGDGNLDKMNENLLTLKSDFAQDEETHKHALFELLNLSYYRKNFTQAKQYLAEMEAKYPDDMLTKNAAFLMGVIDSSSADQGFKKEVVSKKEIPEKFALLNNYPNPFNPATTIGYQLPEASKVTLKVYDMIGREVATLVDVYAEAGEYSVVFHATHLSSGMYFYELKAGNYRAVKKMLLVK